MSMEAYTESAELIETITMLYLHCTEANTGMGSKLTTQLACDSGHTSCTS